MNKLFEKMKSNKVISLDEEQIFVEIELDDKGIENLIDNLNKLKENKNHFHFKLSKGELLIHHENDELK